MKKDMVEEVVVKKDMAMMMDMVDVDVDMVLDGGCTEGYGIGGSVVKVVPMVDINNKDLVVVMGWFKWYGYICMFVCMYVCVVFLNLFHS